MKHILLITAFLTTLISSAAPVTSSVTRDNSEVNKRDRSAGEVTADQQGSSDRDIEITRNIRQAVLKDDSLSTYAHNVKIVTQKGHVTLKGPVNSSDEKTNVQKKAWDVAGRRFVTNRLEITKSK